MLHFAALFYAIGKRGRRVFVADGEHVSGSWAVKGCGGDWRGAMEALFSYGDK